MAGLSIDTTGCLDNIKSLLVKDEVLTLPDCVHRLSPILDIEFSTQLRFNKIYVKANDFDLRKSYDGIRNLVHYCNSDLCINVPYFTYFKRWLLSDCNLYSRSEFNNSSMSRLKKVVEEYGKYQRANIIDKTYFIANDKWTYWYNLKTGYFSKKANSKIVY